MIEIRFHGRGGQGAVIASKILANAMFIEGKYVQSFPAFGVERRGAPVQAFLRVDDKPINLRCAIYEPDHLIILDATLIDQIDVTHGLKKGGTITINSDKSPQVFIDKLGNDYKIATVDASAIAVEFRLGSRAQPIVNTAMCGAFAKATGLVGLEAVKQAIIEGTPIKQEANAQAAEKAYSLLELLQ